MAIKNLQLIKKKGKSPFLWEVEIFGEKYFYSSTQGNTIWLTNPHKIDRKTSLISDYHKINISIQTDDGIKEFQSWVLYRKTMNWETSLYLLFNTNIKWKVYKVRLTKKEEEEY